MIVIKSQKALPTIQHKEMWNTLVAMKKSGVILLPPYYDVVYIDKEEQNGQRKDPQ